MADRRAVNLTFQLTGDNFPHAWFFNRFRVDKIGDSFLITFGLATEAGGILAVNGIVLGQADMEHNRQRAMDYLSKVSDSHDKSCLMAFTAPPARVYPVNHMNLARVDKIAEIGFFRFSVNSLADKIRELDSKPESKTAPLLCYPVVMFRCDLAVQLAFVKALYSV